MKTVFDAYGSIWNDDIIKSVSHIIKKIYVLHLPEDENLLSQVPAYSTVVILNQASIPLALRVLKMGFSHCIAKDREDFSFELLMSSLMCFSPAILTKNEFPFSFANFIKPEEEVPTAGQSFYFSESSLQKKSDLMDNFDLFLKTDKRTAIIRELAVEIADELFSNAFLHSKKTLKIAIVPSPQVEFFATIDHQSLTLGCKDPFGTFDRESLLTHLLYIYSAEGNDQNPTEKSHLGLKMVIDNAASVYLYVEKQKKSIVACTLLLKGLHENLKPNKHLHIISVEN